MPALVVASRRLSSAAGGADEADVFAGEILQAGDAAVLVDEQALGIEEDGAEVSDVVTPREAGVWRGADDDIDLVGLERLVGLGLGGKLMDADGGNGAERGRADGGADIRAEGGEIAVGIVLALIIGVGDDAALQGVGLFDVIERGAGVSGGGDDAEEAEQEAHWGAFSAGLVKGSATEDVRAARHLPRGPWINRGIIY